MNYPQLCRWLVSLRGSAPVYFDRYPQLGAVDAAQAEWTIWQHDGVFDVGGVERGRFVSTAQFATEEAACDYLAGVFRRAADVPPETADARHRSKAVSAETNALLEAMFAPEQPDR